MVEERERESKGKFSKGKISFKMKWFLSIIVLSFSFNSLSEAKKLPSAVIVGTVYCDTCFQAEFSKTSRLISDALVAVECNGTGSNPSFLKNVRTNERGKFSVHLPFSVSKHVREIKGCSVKLISSSEPYCAVASTATSSSLHLKSRKQGTHIFSAGFFTFKPHNQPNLCNQKPSNEFNSRKFLPLIPAVPNFPSPVQDPTIPNPPPTDQNFLPPLPALPRLPPLPQLPPLPALPGIPFLPPLAKKSVQSKSENPLKTSDLSKGEVVKQQILPPTPQLPLFSSPPPVAGIQFPPNPVPRIPFRPPPLNFPPNPFQPSPPSINVPTIPTLSPSPPPPVFSNPLPPFPFQPGPRIPGFPPASSSSSSSSSSLNKNSP